MLGKTALWIPVDIQVLTASIVR